MRASMVFRPMLRRSGRRKHGLDAGLEQRGKEQVAIALELVQLFGCQSHRASPFVLAGMSVNRLRILLLALSACICHNRQGSSLLPRAAVILKEPQTIGGKRHPDCVRNDIL
jgi:hypothetical protein